MPVDRLPAIVPIPAGASVFDVCSYTQESNRSWDDCTFWYYGSSHWQHWHSCALRFQGAVECTDEEATS